MKPSTEALAPAATPLQRLHSPAHPSVWLEPSANDARQAAAASVVEEGAPVILLHCSASSGRQWSGLAAALTRRRPVRTPDLAGHGEAGDWEYTGITTLEADARQVGELLRREGPAHLVGHSYGGAVALKVAARWPERLLSLTVYEPVMMRWLFDDGEYSQSACTVLNLACNLRYALRDGRSVKAARAFIDFWSGEGAWDVLSPARQQSILRTLPAVNAHFDALFGDDLDPAPLTALPLLYLTGDHTNTAAHDISRAAMKRLPGAHFRQCAHMAHMGPITHAESVAREWEGFVNGLGIDGGARRALPAVE